MSHIKRTVALFVWCFTSVSVQAGVFQGDPGNYLGILSGLQPGDILELQAGSYSDGLSISDLNGQPGNRIIIRGPTDGGEAIMLANVCCNTVEISGSSFVEISHLTLDGQNLPGPFGINSRGPTHDITISDLKIVGHGKGQGIVGISTKGSAWNWIIRRNLIIGAGTGMYLGNSTGAAPFFGGLIEENVILDSIGYNIQIKQQNPRPIDLGLPTNDHKTIIRHNVFSKQYNASTTSPRPNLLVGHLPLSGAGQNDVYEIYGNFFYENPTEALFQGEGNIGLYNNLFFTTNGIAVNIIPHKHRPREVRVFQNTIIAGDRGIRLSGGDSGFAQKVLGNAVFASSPISAADQNDNIVDSYDAANQFLIAVGPAVAQLNMFPLMTVLRRNALDTSELMGYTDWELDFNGEVRDQEIRGGYGAEGQNPGWKLARDFKDIGSGGGGVGPTAIISVSPGSVAEGENATLTWSSTRSEECLASGGWTGDVGLEGERVVGPIDLTTTYGLTCSNQFGSATSTATVVVDDSPGGLPAPMLELSADPVNIGANDFSTLNWSSANATSCLASGGWSGEKPTLGSEQVGPLTETQSYTQTCAGPGGESARTVTIIVASTDSGATEASPSGSAVGIIFILLASAGIVARKHAFT